MVVALSLPLLGCLSNEIIPAAIDPPAAYRAGPRKADAALPSVVWWRGFRSKELTDLIEESLTSNFDVAVAVARIVQADATSRVAGASSRVRRPSGAMVDRPRWGLGSVPPVAIVP